MAKAHIKMTKNNFGQKRTFLMIISLSPLRGLEPYGS